MSRETIFVIQAHQGETHDLQLIDCCVVEVYATDEKTAIAKAKKYITKKNYRVNQIIEK